MVQHHLVVFPANARFLVAAKGRMGRVCVVTVYPHTARLHGTGYFVSLVHGSTFQALVEKSIIDFNGFSYFCRIFKKKHQMQPSAYKENG